ncbi:MAG: flavodoxin FldA [Enterobacterales bacterium]
MKDIGVFFGSDTGNTENIAKNIQKNIGEKHIDIYDISQSNSEDIKKYNKLIFGIPTWYYGEAQCDWDDFVPVLKTINFTNKLIAIFGCGDQEDYAEYFCDAMYIIYNIIKINGGKIVGFWKTDGYYFESSKSIINKNYFVGLAIDEDRQPELTKNRIKKWIKQLKIEMNF